MFFIHVSIKVCLLVMVLYSINVLTYTRSLRTIGGLDLLVLALHNYSKFYLDHEFGFPDFD